MRIHVHDLSLECTQTLSGFLNVQLSGRILNTIHIADGSLISFILYFFPVFIERLSLQTVFSLETKGKIVLLNYYNT